MTGDAKRPARRDQVLDLLKDAPGPLGVAEIAERLAAHPNTVRFHLDRLVAAGRVERRRSDRVAPGRPAHVFRPAQGMDPAGPRHYRLLAAVLARGLAAAPDAGDRAVEAGRDWGLRTAGDRDGPGTRDGVERLTALLDDLGFAPERHGAARIGLRHCPFLELAETDPVVCRVHLGLMRGALEGWGSPVTVDRLEPFAEPGLCLAVTAPAAAPPPQ